MLYSDIRVHLYFKKGQLCVHTEDKSNSWSVGFKPTVEYNDVYGDAQAENW